MINLTHVEWIFRIVLSGFLGAIIGYERHNKSKEAGVRTHAIVALGSCLMMILSKYGFADAEHFDAARVAAQVVSGIGFLGAGIIFVRHDTVQGLTTAAGVWTTSGIGLAIGAGLYVIGVTGAVLVVLIQVLFQSHLLVNAPRTTVRLLLRLNKNVPIKNITKEFHNYGYTITENRVSPDPKDPESWALHVEATTLKNVEPAKLLNDLENVSFIREIEIEE